MKTKIQKVLAIVLSVLVISSAVSATVCASEADSSIFYGYCEKGNNEQSVLSVSPDTSSMKTSDSDDFHVPMPDYQLTLLEKIVAFFMAIWKYIFSFLPF